MSDSSKRAYTAPSLQEVGALASLTQTGNVIVTDCRDICPT